MQLADVPIVRQMAREESLALLIELGLVKEKEPEKKEETKK